MPSACSTDSTAEDRARCSSDMSARLMPLSLAAASRRGSTTPNICSLLTESSAFFGLGALLRALQLKRIAVPTVSRREPTIQLPSAAAIHSTVSFTGNSRHPIDCAYNSQGFYVVQGARNTTSQQPSLHRLRLGLHQGVVVADHRVAVLLQCQLRQPPPGYVAFPHLHQPTLPQPSIGLADDRVKMRQVGHLTTQARLPQAPERVLLARQHVGQGSRVQLFVGHLLAQPV